MSNNLITDITNKTSETLQEAIQKRFGDPFLSTFTLVYAIWNFEIFLLAFSNLEVQLKINAITATLTKDPILYVIPSSLYYPSLMTAFIVLASPYLFSKFYDIAFMNTTRVENSKLKAQQKLLPLQFELKNIQDRLSDEVSKNNALNSVISDKDHRIGALEQKEVAAAESIKNLELRVKQFQQKNALLPTVEQSISTESKSNAERDLETLKKLNLSIDFILPPKEYSKKNSLSAIETIDNYLHIIDQLALEVFNGNQQSQKMKTALQYYNQVRSRKDFYSMAHQLNEASKTPSIQSEEKQKFDLAINLLQGLHNYTT